MHGNEDCLFFYTPLYINKVVNYFVFFILCFVLHHVIHVGESPSNYIYIVIRYTYEKNERNIILKWYFLIPIQGMKTVKNSR